MSSPRIPTVVLDQIERHVKSVTDREVGGVLVGTVGDGSVTETDVVAAIPALRAVGASANVTFTHEVWDETLQIVDRDHPDKKIVGWYHSHPDFGVFLSEYDLFIQQNFFPLPGMLALVIDPIRGEAGWFTTVGDEVVQTASYAIEPVASRAAVEAQQSATRNRSYAMLLYGTAAVLVAFVVGWVVSPGGSGRSDESALAAVERRANDAQQRVSELEQDLARVESATGDANDGTSGEAPPNTTTTTTIAPTTTAPEPPDEVGGSSGGTSFEILYRVRANDSLWRVAERFYGDGNRWVEIADANGITSGSIDPGDELAIPGSGGGPGAFEVGPADG